MDKKNSSKSITKSDRKIIVMLITAILFLYLFCFCSFISGVGYFAYLYDLEDSQYDTYEDNSFDFFDNIDQGYRKYIDPEIDEESENLLFKSQEKFIFVYSDFADYGNYDYEEKFLLVNLQYEYERLSSIFEFEIEDEVSILFTDEQEEFENRMGFDYQDELAVAGNTLYREVQFYIHPDKVYTKNSLYEILSHELVHLFQVEGTNDALYPYPRWFSEGTAEYFADAERIDLGYYDVSKDLSTLSDISEAMESGVIVDTQASYNLAYHFIEHLVDVHGEQKIKMLMFPSFYSEINSSETPIFVNSFRDTYYRELNSYPETDYEDWHKSVFQ